MKRSNIIIIVSLAVLLALFLFSCEKKEKIATPKPAKKIEKPVTAPTVDSSAVKQMELQQQLDAMLKDLDARRADLMRKQRELEGEIKALREKQSEVLSVQSQLKTFQLISIILLALGLLAIVVGVVMIMRSRKADGAEKISEAPVELEKKAEAKAGKKKSGNKVKQEKSDEKPKPRKPRTRTKKAPPTSEGENKKEG